MVVSTSYLLEVFDCLEVEALFLNQVEIFIVQLVSFHLLCLLPFLHLQHTVPAVKDWGTTQCTEDIHRLDNYQHETSPALTWYWGSNDKV